MRHKISYSLIYIGALITIVLGLFKGNFDQQITGLLFCILAEILDFRRGHASNTD